MATITGVAMMNFQSVTLAALCLFALYHLGESASCDKVEKEFRQCVGKSTTDAAEKIRLGSNQQVLK